MTQQQNRERYEEMYQNYKALLKKCECCGRGGARGALTIVAAMWHISKPRAHQIISKMKQEERMKE